MVHQLAYLSSSLEVDDPPGIDRILEAAHRNNPKLGITGALCFADGMFFQILEGTQTEVRTLFEAIRLDTRHTGVVLLVERDVPERIFTDWSMAWYKCPDGHPLARQVRHVHASTDLIRDDMDELLGNLIKSVLRSMRP